MTIPRHAEKLDEPSLVTPEASIGYFYDDPAPVPDAVVLCYHDGLMEHAEEAYDVTAFEAFGEGLTLDATDGTVGVLRVPGVGAPAAALSMEGLVARGTRTVLSVGHAGALDPALGVGDLVVVDGALRDEGTSHHYLEPTDYVDADAEVVAALEAAIEGDGAPFRVGPTWTIDAPYRETRVEVERYRTEGILTVDMEAAAVFAVAAYRDVRAGAVFAVSDVLDVDGWEPAFDETGPPLERLLRYAVEAVRDDGDRSQ